MDEYKGIIVLLMIIAIAIVIILSIIINVISTKKEMEDSKEFRDSVGKSLHEIYKDKGSLGEYEAYNIAKRKLQGKYKLFNSVYLPKSGDKTTEVDLIVVHERCIFIVEVKNYSGIIFGDKYNKKWTQKLNKFNSNGFYNPVIQNKNHIKYFKDSIDTGKYGLCDKNIYSIIVFGDKANINNIRIDEDNLKVIGINELENTLNSIVEKNTINLSDNEIEDISYILNKYTNASSEVKEKHIRDIIECN
jgi:Holliday junction resolvase-like predicted endonuclease